MVLLNHLTAWRKVMPLSDRFMKTLDAISTLPHASSTHTTVWSMPGDLAEAAAAFRRLWELGERAGQDEVAHYLEGNGISSENAMKIQDAWETVDHALGKTPSVMLKLEFLPPEPRSR
jgi:hypothetical protein